VDHTTGDVIVGPSHTSILLQKSPLSQGLQGRARVFTWPVFSRDAWTQIGYNCSLVEGLDMRPSAVLLMSGGKLPARRANSAHFVGHVPLASLLVFTQHSARCHCFSPAWIRAFTFASSWRRARKEALLRSALPCFLAICASRDAFLACKSSSEAEGERIGTFLLK
jgi:hypothetical protein